MSTTVPPFGRVDVYPVGFLRDVHNLTSQLIRPRGTSNRRSHLRWHLRRFLADCRRRSYWNGYLAEPYDAPVPWARCGRAWTRYGALRSLERRHRADAVRYGWAGRA